MRPIVYPATAADVAATFTPPLPVDYNRVNGQYGIQYQNAGNPGAGTAQMTLDDPFNPPTGGLTWANVALNAGRAWLNQAVRAFRINNPSAGDVITIVAQGGSPAG